jgi:hypothetical protein
MRRVRREPVDATGAGLLAKLQAVPRSFHLVLDDPGEEPLVDS